MKFASLLLGFAIFSCAAAPAVRAADTAADFPKCSARHPALCPIVDRPGLPRVLLIGDSVSVAYTLPVRQRLAGVANVHRIPRNGGSTTVGLRFLEQWLGSAKWDVIHVNFGLHDAEMTQSGVAATDLQTYARNVTAIISRLKSASSHVIWATTTPVPSDVDPATHRWADIAAYNKVATGIARREGVAVDDLYGTVLPQEAGLQRPRNVHFTTNGSDVLAGAVAASITAQLRRNRS